MKNIVKFFRRWRDESPAEAAHEKGDKGVFTNDFFKFLLGFSLLILFSFFAISVFSAVQA